MCQSVNAPVCGPEGAVLYWHIGATKMRFRKVAERILSGRKSVGVEAESFTGAPGESAWAGVK